MGGTKDYQWKEGSQGKETDDYGKDERLPMEAKKITREGRKINKGRKEVKSQPREGRKMTMGRMKDYKGKEGRLQTDKRKSTEAR